MTAPKKKTHQRANLELQPHATTRWDCDWHPYTRIHHGEIRHLEPVRCPYCPAESEPLRPFTKENA